MSEGMTYFCDVCGIQKKETNHWFKGYIIDAGPLSENEQRAVGMLIVPWDVQEFSRLFGREALPEKPDAHLCGEGHALEWASKVLSKGNGNA